MSVMVKTAKELKEVLNNKEERIIIKGRLAKKIKPLSIIKMSNKNIGLKETMRKNMVAGSLTLAGMAASVAIALIVTIGVVSIVVILNDYRIVYKNGDDEIILERI
ncbi:hypothetical protein [Clostridium sp.]|jgi:uncharacterized membrane-anchored protein|uniref:hypothetical protein n=1 Tax=Clostridium sp. TaxID=1506 RepID=UPI001A4E3D1E|nr:hypothetical protein [Clostridium sp.]MBK5241939.1 hypothetical protein [Clostridium sp.]